MEMETVKASIARISQNMTNSISTGICECGKETPDGWVLCRECQKVAQAQADNDLRESIKREKIDGWLKASGIQKRQQLMTLENFKSNKNRVPALKLITEINGLPSNLYFYGPVGTGKTHLAVILLRRLILDLGIETKFITGVNLLYEIRSTFSGQNNYEADDYIKRYSKYPVLIIDDLGAEKSTDWVRETFYLIIDNRYSNMLPTIITSNLSPKLLAEKLDDRIVSRLMDGAKIIKLEGNDYRLKGDK
jgi:DNA replication protein DnaC